MGELRWNIGLSINNRRREGVGGIRVGDGVTYLPTPHNSPYSAMVPYGVNKVVVRGGGWWWWVVVVGGGGG